MCGHCCPNFEIIEAQLAFWPNHSALAKGSWCVCSCSVYNEACYALKAVGWRAKRMSFLSLRVAVIDGGRALEIPLRQGVASRGGWL
jgi:hypothetical protein